MNADQVEPDSATEATRVKENECAVCGQVCKTGKDLKQHVKIHIEDMNRMIDDNQTQNEEVVEQILDNERKSTENLSSVNIVPKDKVDESPKGSKRSTTPVNILFVYLSKSIHPFIYVYIFTDVY